ncbi:MAG TPA: A24 family peptidase [candidate division Zixibacteria bacterium]|nr:A24 family peptidase [candidate division Zixibacteria bacterium]
MAVDLAILSVLGLGAYFDLKERRIPNWLIAFALLGGLMVNGLGLGVGLSNSLLGFGAAIVVLIVPFGLGWLGAGDVKLLAAVGSILGVAFLPRVFFYSALVAGVVALFSVLVGAAKIGSFRNLWLDLKVACLTLGRAVPQSTAARVSKGGYPVPWGVAIGAGTIIAYYVDSKGSWAGF